jgi:ATP-dependent DNA helicase RecG
MEAEILSLLQKRPLSKGEIAKQLGHHAVSGRLKKVLVKLFARGVIEYTVPEKPNSRLQKYKITEMVPLE